MTMHNRSLLTILISFFVLTSLADTHAAEQETWTLEQCVNAARKNSFALESRRAVMAGAEAAMRASDASRWPTLGLSGAYSYTSETQKLEFASPIPGFVMPSVEFGDGNVYDAAIIARAPLFAGGALGQRARADAAAYRSTQQDFFADSLRLLWNVRRAYFQALGAEARAQTARQALARMERHVREISAAISAGWQSEEARIAAAAALRQIESARIAAEAQASVERLKLGSLVGAPEREIFPDGDLDARATEIPLTTESPIEARAEMLALQSRIEQSGHLTHAARGSLLPSLSAMAAYHYGKPGVNVVENEWMDYYVVGLNASWTLWDWNARKYQVKQTRAQMNILDAQKSELERSLSNREKIARLTWTSARAAREKSAERVTLERERFALVEGRWREGMASESELLDAQDDLTQAETDLAAARANERIAEVDWRYAAGY